jgi:DNA-binding winged helix-turn-helix (wHTH) protein
MNSDTSKRGRRFFEFGRYRLDVENRLLLKDGELVPLKRKAVETLLVLVERRGKVVSKDELIQTLWPDSFVEESNLSQYIYLLRKTLGEGEYITTISGRGYRFAAEAREIGEPDDQIVLESQTIARLVITEEHSGDPVTGATVARPLIKQPGNKLIPTTITRHKRAIFLSAPALVVIAVIVWLWGKFGAAGPPTPPPRLVLATSYAGNGTMPALSPDGKQIAFIWDGE